MAGAIPPVLAERLLAEAGFSDIAIERKENSRDIIAGFGLGGAEDYTFSAYVTARKPKPTS